MSEKTFNPGLWQPRSVAETRKIYAEWADSYDADVGGAGYITPSRVAAALFATLPDHAAPILDYGCGTGLSGAALKSEGYVTIDGTDISPEMLKAADAKGIYRKTWLTDLDAPSPVTPGDYAAITATGVISLGAAPPETLVSLLDLLAPGGFLALSFNDATLEDARYLDAMAAATDGPARLVSEEYGPHLPGKDMGSTVYVLCRT